MVFGEVAARPIHRRRFERAIGEKRDEDERHAFEFHRLRERERLCGDLLRRAFLPERQAEKEHRHERELNIGDDAVSARPARRPREARAHDERTDDRADAPEAVQPAHVAGFIVQRDVVVERSVHAARAQPVRHGEHAQNPEGVRKGKADHRARRQQHADDGDDARSELSGEEVGRKAGYDRTRGDDHRHRPHRRERRAEFDVHHGPSRPEQGIGKPERNKGEIDDGKQE